MEWHRKILQGIGDGLYPALPEILATNSSQCSLTRLIITPFDLKYSIAVSFECKCRWSSCFPFSKIVYYSILYYCQCFLFSPFFLWLWSKYGFFIPLKPMFHRDLHVLFVLRTHRGFQLLLESCIQLPVPGKAYLVPGEVPSIPKNRSCLPCCNNIQSCMSFKKNGESPKLTIWVGTSLNFMQLLRKNTDD